MNSLIVERSAPRFAAARLASLVGSGRGAGIGPLRLIDGAAPTLPAGDWHRVQPVLSGICGSDLATLDGRSSRYFEDLVSFPFVPGHEIVGTLENGRRVVIEPVLSCEARGIVPRCPSCEQGNTGICERVVHGHLRPGLQTGYCTQTGGGWSRAGLVAHASQLHDVPDDMDDETAVTVEPLACAIHAVLAAGVREGDVVAVLGAGTLGLLIIAALADLTQTNRLHKPSALIVGGRYAHQRSWAVEFGATDAVDTDQFPRAVRRASGSLAYGAGPGRAGRLTGGADLVFDCVGTAESISTALGMVRPRGRIALVGMPGAAHVDLAPLWHREVTLAGVYAYGNEKIPDGPPIRTFDLALAAAGRRRTGRLVSARYPLERYEEAIAHAGAAGRRGAVRIAFDLQETPSRRDPADNLPSHPGKRARA